MRMPSASCGAALAMALAMPLHAQGIGEAPGAVRGPRAAESVLSRATGVPADSLSAIGRDDGARPSLLSRFSVVELPPTNALPGARRHHAISIPFDGARGTLRQLGIDAVECRLQVRAPSRLARDAVAGAHTTLDVQAQVRLACTM